MTLSLNEVDIPNDGYVLVTDIAEGGTGMNDGGLLCITNRIDCCRGGGQGEWYFPNGTAVGIRGTRTGNFFYRNRDARIVRLNRFGTGTPTERGRFRCVVPNAAGNMVTVYVNIGEWFVSSSMLL